MAHEVTRYAARSNSSLSACPLNNDVDDDNDVYDNNDGYDNSDDDDDITIIEQRRTDWSPEDERRRRRAPDRPGRRRRPRRAFCTMSGVQLPSSSDGAPGCRASSTRDQCIILAPVVGAKRTSVRPPASVASCRVLTTRDTTRRMTLRRMMPVRLLRCLLLV